MRIENLDWQNRVIFVPDSKTAEGRRLVLTSRRVFEILRNRCTDSQKGWVFPSNRSASGHLRSICSLFRKARNKAGLPQELVLYCARHDYGPRVLMRTGNLAAVMRTMGHRDAKTAMHYQHPEARCNYPHIRSIASQLSCSRSHDCIVENMRVPSVRAASRKLFKKPKSKFYWYDFTVRGRRYRASAQETEVS